MHGYWLVRGWGAGANRNIGIIRERMARALAGMSPDDAEAAGQWFDNLSSQEAHAVLRTLASQ